MKKGFIRQTMVALLGIASMATTANAAIQALADGSYTIEVSKFKSDGTLSLVSTNPATATGGKLDFTLSSIPTKDDANFIYLELKDSTGTVKRKGFAPAPPANDTNKLGINELADKQAEILKATVAKAGSDDPIMIAYLLIILRSPGVNTADVDLIAQMGQKAIIGTSTTGFEGFLTTQNVSSTALTNLKKCLVYNSDATKKTLRNFSESYYNAVNLTDATLAGQEMQKAGGFMAEVFLDAAVCADVSPELILAAHNEAGVAIGADGGAPTPGSVIATLAAQNPSLMQAIDGAMSSFDMRIAASKVATEYTDALTTLKATGTQVTTFLDAGKALMQSMATTESTYAGFYSDPQTYATAQGKTVDQIKTAIEAAHQASFTAFQTAIASTDADKNTMKAKVQVLLPQGATLPTDFGTYRDFSGTTKNWPIPQTVMVSWVADIVNPTTGGSFGYTRDTTTLPTWAEAWWMGQCTLSAVPDQTTCQSLTPMPGMWNSTTSKCTVMAQKSTCTTNGGTWDPRQTMNTGNAAFTALLGLQQDIQILEMNRYAIYQGTTPPTRDQEKAAKAAFEAKMAALAANITGNTNASTAITAHEKEAIIKLMKQPSME